MVKKPEKIIRVMKYEIKNPNGYTKEEINYVYNRLFEETRWVLNKSTQLCWEFEGFSSDYVMKYNKELTVKDISKYNSLQNFAYDKLKNQVKYLYSGNLTQTVKTATVKWGNDLEKIKKGEVNPATYKTNVPIEIASGSKYVNIYQDEKTNKFYANIKVLGTNLQKELNKPSTDILYEMVIKDNTQRSIINRIFNGEYTVKTSKIQKLTKKSKEKYMFILTYEFDKKKSTLDKNNVMGIDLGVKIACVMGFNNSKDRYYIGGEEIAEYKKRMESRKISLQRQSKFCSEGRRGHGYNARMKPLEKLSKREHNFNETTNHKYAKYIVRQALDHNCGIIQMENLEGIKQSNKDCKFLGAWTYYSLQSKIEEKATEKGIKVVKINPKYTSQRCSVCGYIDKENRQTQEKFKCKCCGNELNADLNASLNIATQNIEGIIRTQSYIQDLYGKEEYVSLVKLRSFNEIKNGDKLIKAVNNFFTLHYNLKTAKNNSEGKDKIEKIQGNIEKHKEEILKIKESTY